MSGKSSQFLRNIKAKETGFAAYVGDGCPLDLMMGFRFGGSDMLACKYACAHSQPKKKRLGKKKKACVISRSAQRRWYLHIPVTDLIHVLSSRSSPG